MRALQRSAVPANLSARPSANASTQGPHPDAHPGAHPNAHYVAPEHEFEAEPGLPEPLPRGERLLWRGGPDWRVLAREAMHTRQLAIYFSLLLGLRAATTLAGGGSLREAAHGVLLLLPLALLALAALSLMGWLIARTTVYTVTDKRVVMRVGVVLSITFNLPHAQIEAAGLRSNADGSGDLTLTLAGSDRIAYAHLWPHARPWHLKRTQPMLRALPDAKSVAAILAAALAESAGMEVAAGAAVVALPASLPLSPLAVPNRGPVAHGANAGARQPLAA